MGVLHENPMVTTGVINILYNLAHYIPNMETAALSIVWHGDGMSVEKIIFAIRGRFNCATRRDTMQWMWPCPYEFHKDLQLLRVIW